MLKPKRHIMRIELSAKAKKNLQDDADSSGMTQVATMSKLVEWYTAQPVEMKALVLGQIPDSVRGGYIRLLIKHLA